MRKQKEQTYNPDNKIQKSIISLRKKYDFSLEDLASRLGVTRITVYRWEKGVASPTSRLVKNAIKQLKKELKES